MLLSFLDNLLYVFHATASNSSLVIQGDRFGFNPFCSEWYMLINNTRQQVFPKVQHFIWVIARCNAGPSQSCEDHAAVRRMNLWLLNANLKKPDCFSDLDVLLPLFAFLAKVDHYLSAWQV